MIEYHLSLISLIKKLSQSNSLGGYTKLEIKTAETKLGISIPEPLKEYYLTCGKETINFCFEQFLKPEEFYFDGVNLEYFVFCDENQGVLQWAVLKEDLSNYNPPVYATSDGGKTFLLFAEHLDLFLLSILFQQILGSELDYIQTEDKTAWKEIEEKYQINLSSFSAKNAKPILSDNLDLQYLWICANEKFCFLFFSSTINIQDIEKLIIISLTEELISELIEEDDERFFLE